MSEKKPYSIEPVKLGAAQRKGWELRKDGFRITDSIYFEVISTACDLLNNQAQIGHDTFIFIVSTKNVKNNKSFYNWVGTNLDEANKAFDKEMKSHGLSSGEETKPSELDVEPNIQCGQQLRHTWRQNEDWELRLDAFYDGWPSRSPSYKEVSKDENS